MTVEEDAQLAYEESTSEAAIEYANIIQRMSNESSVNVYLNQTNTLAVYHYDSDGELISIDCEELQKFS